MNGGSVSVGARAWSEVGTETAGPPAPVAGLLAAVLATLAYPDLLHLPLTSMEAWRYLLRPNGPDGPAAGGMRKQGEAGRLRDVEDALSQLVARGHVETRHGFYYFPGREGLVEDRITKHARSQEKWARLRRIAVWWQALPFLRGVAVTGSLALENPGPESDLDVLVIAAPNRVWTVRCFLTVFLDVFRLRRRPRGVTRDRVCLNHYLSADVLAFPYRSLYTALEYARAVPLLGESVCQAFRAANRPWMTEYLIRVFPDAVSHQKTLRPTATLVVCQRVAERLLTGVVGDRLERVLAALQQARIARSAVTGAPGGRVVATDARAEFHPHSREAPLLRAFNERMVDLRLVSAFGRQADSGLT